MILKERIIYLLMDKRYKEGDGIGKDSAPNVSLQRVHVAAISFVEVLPPLDGNSFC